MDITQFDYVDFGGLSVIRDENVASRFRAKNGLVLSSDPKILDLAKAAGIEALEGSLTDISRLEGKCRFSVIGSALEHCESYSEVCEIIKNAFSISRSFVFLKSPWFDSEGNLFRDGLKLHWSDWDAHKTSLTSLQLYRAIKPFLDKGSISRFTLYGQGKIESSEDSRILPLSAGRNSGRFNVERHGSKPDVSLAYPVYDRLVGVIARRDATIIERALEKTAGLSCIYDSAKQDGSILGGVEPQSASDPQDVPVVSVENPSTKTPFKKVFRSSKARKEPKGRSW